MKIVILLLLTIFVCRNTLAQDNLTKTETLAATAKVWGFLKYYHPQVAGGKYDWDEQLFEVLPKIKNTTNKEQFSQVLVDWIESLGEIQKCKKCSKTKDKEYFDKNFDLSWFYNDKVFSSKLSKALKNIEKNRHQGKNKYVSVKKWIGNIDVLNEKEYNDFDWTNRNLRLLTLFRYWNIIEYFFPYKYQTDTKWDTVLNKMIPKFSSAKTEIDFHLAMLELIVNIDDSHGSFSTPQIYNYFGNKSIPAKITLIGDSAILTGYYNDSLAAIDDLRIGDVITKVNGKKIEVLFQEKLKFISGSNIPRKKANAYHVIFNGTTDSLKIEYVRDQKIYSKIIKRYSFKDFNYKRKKIEKTKFELLKDNIGYVNLGVLEKQDVPEMMDKLKETKVIIFDIRNYPKGTSYLIASYISSKTNQFFKSIAPDLSYPGKFVWEKGIECGNDTELKYKGKVVLLVNEHTQSHAEFTAMCLQTGDNVTTIGSQSSGADGNVSKIKMVSGHKTMISGIGIFYPDGTETQRKGVKVDIEIKPTIQGIINTRDEVLERAIEFVNN